MLSCFKINGRSIGKGCAPYLIAEMSGNHNNDIGRAFAIIKAAKAAGADAIKLQTYTPDTITMDHDGEGFMIKEGLWKGRNLYELYSEAMTPWQWHADLFQYAREQDITIFSSPFDRTAIDFLEDLNAPAYKIASFEMTDLPLVRTAAETGKPLIISTGLANHEEIAEVIDTVRATGNEQLAILHCVSAYPSDPKDANLATLVHMANSFGVICGLSDHSHGIAVPVASVALGSAVIEKHMTLSRKDGGVDSDFSLEPDEFRDMVQACKIAYDAIGTVNYELKDSEKASLNYRRSLYAVTDIKKDEILTEKNMRSIRPAYGLKPKYYEDVLGKKAAQDISRGTPLSWHLIECEPRDQKP